MRKIFSFVLVIIAVLIVSACSNTSNQATQAPTSTPTSSANNPSSRSKEAADSNSAFSSNKADQKKSQGPLENIAYYIIPKHAQNSVLDTYGGNSSKSEGSNIVLWNYGNGNYKSRMFRFVSVDGSWYKIVNENNGLVLDVNFSNKNVALYKYHGGANQLWKLEDAGNGYYYIRTKVSDGNKTAYYLDVHGAYTSNGTNVEVCDLNKGDNQKFKLMVAVTDDSSNQPKETPTSNPATSANNSMSEPTAAVNTVMDLFDGGRKIWFFCPNDSSPRFDSEVELILVTENKKVTELYYNWVDDLIYTEGCAEVTGGTQYPNPFSTKRFLLSDFEGLSDAKILQLAREKYKDASEGLVFRLIGNYSSGNHVVGMIDLPYAIQYSGAIDDSGNNLESEYIKLFDWSPFGSFAGKKGVPNYLIPVNEIITSARVKSEEYIGIEGSNDVLITKNTIGKIGNLDFDSPEKMIDYYDLY